MNTPLPGSPAGALFPFRKEISFKKPRTLRKAPGIPPRRPALNAEGTLFWERATNRAVDQLLSDGPGGVAPGFSPDALEGLPDPVLRYFMFALSPGAPLPRTARIHHEGTFRSDRDAPWNPFTSVEYFSARPPGFVWDARIRMGPLARVRVRDSYVAGAGVMRARIAGLIPVVDAHDRPEITAGALHRFLAEAVWLPTALLPRDGLVWEAVDATTARAILTDAGTTVSLDFTFGLDGEVDRVHTPARYRDVDGTAVPTPWTGRFLGYRRIDGMMIPMEGEVEWTLPDGPLPYWRGRITKAAYDITP